jgi:hypothetical protein
VTISKSLEQREYEDTFNTMNKLPTEAILKGCRTFEINGMDWGVATSGECFVDCMIDSKRMCSFIDASAIYTDIPQLDMELHLWARHYGAPEVVFLVACEILEARGAI